MTTQNENNDDNEFDDEFDTPTPPVTPKNGDKPEKAERPEKEKLEKEPSPVETKKAKKQILKNTVGEDLNPKDYFYATEGKKAETPATFNQICGLPVEREDLLDIFNQVFNVNDNILFYKTITKEVYIIIIPLKYSTSVGRTHESIDGDFQKHAISFIQEGSVNLDTLRAKLKRILPFINFNVR